MRAVVNPDGFPIVDAHARKSRGDSLGQRANVGLFVPGRQDNRVLGLVGHVEQRLKVRLAVGDWARGVYHPSEAFTQSNLRFPAKEALGF